MRPSEAVPLIGDAEAALQRIRAGLHAEAIALNEDAARGARIDTALEVFALLRTVERLARLAGSAKRPPRRNRPADEAQSGVECDRCGGPADQYGDCLAGSHIARLPATR